MKINKIILPIVVCLVLGACAQHLPLPPRQTSSAASLDSLLASDELSAARSLALSDIDWGYLLIDAKSGEVLMSRAADKGFPPASTAKVPTMVAALGILGPTYRFTTQLLAKGSLKAGVLSGDLVLAGDGDPLPSVGDLRALAIRLRDIGVTRLDGRFIYASSLPVFAEIEPEQPATEPYNQGLGGLNIEFNRVTLTRSTGDTGTVPYTTPSEAIDLIPDFPPSTTGRLESSVRDPALLAAQMLQRFALAEGISLPDPVSGTPPDGAVSLAQIRSQPLIEIVRAGLEYSNNMVAEVIGLSASRAQGVTDQSLARSADTLGVWLEHEVPGLKHFATTLANHSGLSTVSRVTPRQMTQILQYALNQRFDGWRFDSLLSPGGRRDTFRGRFKDPATAYRIWAKSGTMRYIKGLTGYLDAESGRRLIFALFMYDPELRARLENDPERFSLQSRKLSTDWRNRTDAFEEALIKHWIKVF
ncbi:MAG: D-alanyl-D-alanine carboxypeptidase [Rhodospirillales bacterium]|nr:D-alanyl-D-alanine carboxypeptidase [Rhodospirillales bacterium]